MAKWVCSVCGYVHEGDTPPEKCPICNVPAEKFVKQEESAATGWATEHKIGEGQGVDAEVLQGLRTARVSIIHGIRRETAVGW